MSACITTPMHIKKKVAKQRIKKFIATQYPILVKYNRNETPSVEYDVSDFIYMLEKFVSISPAPDGVRVYFASYEEIENNTDGNNELIPNGKKDTLTLIYVPVKLNGSKYEDISEFYWIPTSLRNPLPVNISDRWIKHYYNTQLYNIKQVLSIDDTKSIFYHFMPIQKLYQRLDCLYKKGKVKSAAALFGAFKLTETLHDDDGTSLQVSEQMIPIFTFSETLLTRLQELLNDKGEALSIIIRFLVNNVFQWGENNNDTGLPCPPAKSCP